MFEYRVAFTVNRKSKLYRDYFVEKEEREKFRGLATEFLKKYMGEGERTFKVSRQLICTLTDKEKETYQAQIKNNALNELMNTFLIRSPINKQWQIEVGKQVDWDKMTVCDSWWWDFDVGLGKIIHTLWDADDGTLYGYFACEKPKTDAKLPEYVVPVKMSDYYKALEIRDSKNNRT